LCGLHRTGWIKTRPVKKVLVRVKFTVQRSLYSHRTATIVIHANSCLLEPVYSYPDLYLYQCERSLMWVCDRENRQTKVTKEALSLV